MLTLSKLLGGLSDSAIIRAADRFAAGDVPEQSKTFAPATPEFVAEVRRQQEYLSIKAHPRLTAPEYRPSGSMPPFLITRQKLLAKHAHLPVLFEDIAYDQFKKLSKAGEIPVGGKWVASLGIIYGPEAKP